jgi:hypothetical protein
MHRDSVNPESRRVNQNIEIVVANRQIFETSVSGIDNGEVANLNLEFTNVQNEGPVVAFWEIVIYAAPTIDASTINYQNILYPRHPASLIDVADWEVSGPTNVLIPDLPYSVDDFTTPQTMDIQKVTVRNISAGTMDLLYSVRVRYTFNRG